MISVIHPGCNANLRAVVQAYEKEGILQELLTTMSFGKRRNFSIPENKLRLHPVKEIGRLIAERFRFKKLVQHEVGIFSVDRVWQDLDRWASKRISLNSKVVYAYEDAALDSFRCAKQRGIKTIYDLPIGYWKASQEIYQEEAARFPEFASLIGGLNDSREKKERKEKELESADRVHACSDFVKSTLTRYGYPEEKIRVMQFGAPAVPWRSRECHQRNPALKILFVGRIDQRKGIGYLLKAMDSFDPKKVEFHMVGVKPKHLSALKPYWNRVVDHGILVQPKVWELMQGCDLLILPTLFEGQALVILEAMACGLPVVVTPHAGVEQVVREGVEGFTIPIRSIEAITQKIEWGLKHPEERKKMGEAAFKRAQEFTWEKYQQQILLSTSEVMG